MNKQKILLVIAVFLILDIFSGCASNNVSGKNATDGANTQHCDGYQIPSSSKIYLYISEEYMPAEKIIEILQTNTTYSLLRRVDNLKVISREEDAGPDGLLLKIYVINNQKSLLARRLDIKYELINTVSNNVIKDGKEAAKSRFGYNKVAMALGEKVARRVEPVIKCFDVRRSKWEAEKP